MLSTESLSYPRMIQTYATSTFYFAIEGKKEFVSKKPKGVLARMTQTLTSSLYVKCGILRASFILRTMMRWIPKDAGKCPHKGIRVKQNFDNLKEDEAKRKKGARQ